MDTDVDQYWLARWVDEYEVRDREDVYRLLQLPGPMARLPELASEARTYLSPQQQVPRLSVAAGRGLDLSGYMSCGAYACMRKLVDAAYGRIFHYFDHIVVEGQSPRAFLETLKTLPKSRHSELHASLADDVAIFLYLREIGADKYVVFREKPQALCPHCLDRNAEEFGMSSYRDADLRKVAIDRIVKEAKIEMGWRKGVWRFWVHHDFFENGAMGSIKRAKKYPPTPQEIASSVTRDYAGASIADVAFARRVNAPLARAIEVSWIDRDMDAGIPTDEDVALNLQLPVLDNLPVQDLLKIREDEYPFFEQFRKSIRHAIIEQIARNGSTSPRLIAQSVVQEYVEPALADIDRRLRVNQRKLTHKAAASITVGTAATTAGLMASLPLVIATGVAAIAASLTHVYSYVDSASDIELSDMYFLWKVNKLTREKH